MSSVLCENLPEAARVPSLPHHGHALQGPRDTQASEQRQAIRRGFSWLAVGNIVNAACSWGRLALLARLGNAEMIGQLTLALAVCNPIGALADLGLCGSLISDARRQYRVRDYVHLRLLTCGLTLAVIVAAACLGSYDAMTSRLVGLAGVLVVCESLCDLFQAMLQRQERMQWVAISLILRGILGLGLFALGIWATGNMAWGILGYSVAAVTTLLAIDIPRAMACERAAPGAGRPNASSTGGLSVVLALAWLSLPLGLATAGLSLATSIPRYWISDRLGNEALGGFAAAGSLMVALSLIVGAMSQATSPRLARHHADGNLAAFVGLLRQSAGWLAMVSVGCWLIMAIYGQPIIGLLFGPAYARYADVAACLMLAAGLRNFSILLGRALAAMRRFRTGLLLRTATIVMLVALLPGWVDWLGLMGAAWAVILSWAVGVVLSLAAVLHALKKPRQNTRD